MNKTCYTLGCLLCAGVFASAQTPALQPLTSFGPHGDGSLQPGDRSYITVGDGGTGISGNPYNRGMAYNPVTGHLLIVDHQQGNESINIIDAATGNDVGSLTLDFIVIDSLGGNTSFVLNDIAVADDGAIYVGNLSSANTPAQYRLYRWADESSSPVKVYAGDPANGNTATSGNKRWGDTIAVRGSGTNTQVLIGSRGRLAAILQPTDSTLSSFTATTISSDVPFDGAIGFGITFGPGNTFWASGAGGTGTGTLRLMSFNLASSNATTLQVYGPTNFPGNIGTLSMLVASNFLVGIDVIGGADLVRLYDVSTPGNPPVLLDRKSFDTANGNGNLVGAIAFGANGTVYALDSDNGIMAYSFTTTTAPLSPSVFLQPSSKVVLLGSTLTLAAAADGTAPLSYQWTFQGTNIGSATDTSLTFTNIQLASSGAYALVVSNVAGSATSAVATITVTTNPGPQLLFYEPMDYAAGSSLTNQGGWSLNSGTGTCPIEAGNLNATGLASPTGNRLVLDNTSTSLRRSIGTNLTSGVIYYSYILRVDTLGSTFTGNGTLAGFATGTTTSFGAKTDIRTNGVGGYNLGVSKAGSGSQVWAANNLNVGDPVFIVGRYTFFANSTKDDVADLWINPDPSTFSADVPPNPTITTIAGQGTDLTGLDKFFFRVGSSSTSPQRAVLDEVRVGMTWLDVSPLGPPTLSITLSGTNAIVSWPTLNSGYTLQEINGLGGGNDWANTTQPVVTVGSTNTVTFSAKLNKLFRLQK